MSVSFNNIPASIRVPLFYAEVDNSQAGYFEQNLKTLLIGQKLAAGSADANVPMLVSRTDEARSLFGQGSMLSRMHDVYRNNDDFGEVWCIALDDAAAGVVATGTVALTGTAISAGALNLYIGAQRVQLAVAANETAASVATALAAAINANAELPVTAEAAAGTVTLTRERRPPATQLSRHRWGRIHPVRTGRGDHRHGWRCNQSGPDRRPGRAGR